MTKAKATQFGDWFVNRANIEKRENFGEGISNMKLQKILYFAQAARLSLDGVPLFDEEIYAWKYGPVVKEVYENFKGSKVAIKQPHSDIYEQLDTATTAFLEDIWQTFGKYSPGKLVEMTHAHAPWKTVYNGSTDVIITKDSIKEYYKDIFIRTA